MFLGLEMLSGEISKLTMTGLFATTDRRVMIAKRVAQLLVTHDTEISAHRHRREERVGLRHLGDTPLEDLPDEARDKVSWAGLNFDPEEFSVDQARHALTLAAAWGALKFRPDSDQS